MNYLAAQWIKFVQVSCLINSRIVVFANTFIIFLMLSNSSVAAPVDATKAVPIEIKITTSVIAKMAKHILTEEVLLKRDFANTALITMSHAYIEELDEVLVTDTAMNEKLSNWYRATVSYVDRINAVQRAIGAGAHFSMSVTREEWVLIVTEVGTVLISGPQASVSDISEKVKNKYCHRHDCSWLMQEELQGQGERQEVNQEGWVFQQQRLPTFLINNQMHFVFKDLLQKEFKQDASKRVFNDINLFLLELKKVQLKGYSINWKQVSKTLPVAGAEQKMYLNTGDLYLRVFLPTLAYLQMSDWQRLIEWLQLSLVGDDVDLYLMHADSLLTVEKLN